MGVAIKIENPDPMLITFGQKNSNKIPRLVRLKKKCVLVWNIVALNFNESPLKRKQMEFSHP